MTVPSGVKVVRGPFDEELRAEREGRSGDWRGVVEVALLAGMAVMLLQKVLGGVLPLYLHPRYTWLVVASAVALLLAAGGRLWQVYVATPPARQRGGMVLLALPITLGLLVPAQPLAWDSGAKAAPSLDEVVVTTAPPPDDSRTWNIYEWRNALRASKTAQRDLQGREADVVGFVRHNPNYSFEGFFIARLVIVHCVVDATATSLPVVWPAGSTIPPNSWVQLRGRLGTMLLDGRSYPALIADTVEFVPQPRDPYLFR